MSTSQDEQIDQLVQARWRAIGLSQTDLAEILCTEACGAKNGKDGATRVDPRRLAALAEMLGIFAETVTPPAAPSRHRHPAQQSLQSLLELRMLRVFRDVQDTDTKRILIELAEQIVKRQSTPSDAS